MTLSDGTKLPAELIGSDPWTDLAVITVDGDKIKTVAEFGKSATLKPGEPVIAIGNPLGLQFSGSITQGIISGLERTIEVDINEDGQLTGILKLFKQMLPLIQEIVVVHLLICQVKSSVLTQ